jgi:hypothetical protein
MRKLGISFVLIVITVAFALSQDCEIYFPVNKGQVREMTSFDKKDKPTGISRQTILESNQSSGAFELTILSEVLDTKDEIIFSGEITMACRDGIFYVDMDDLLAGSAAAMSELNITIEGDNLSYPSGMKPGDKLEDGSVTMNIEEAPMMNTTVRIFNRRVEAREEITTEAGTFTCYKISYDTETKSVVTITGSGTEWIAKDVGAVRSESFNKKGKLTGYSVLTKLED